jgi:hypothetical protein
MVLTSNKSVYLTWIWLDFEIVRRSRFLYASFCTSAAATHELEEAKTNPELYQHLAGVVSCLPSSNGLSNSQFYLHDHVWNCGMVPLVGAMVADAALWHPGRHAAQVRDGVDQIAPVHKWGATGIFFSILAFLIIFLEMNQTKTFFKNLTLLGRYSPFGRHDLWKTCAICTGSAQGETCGKPVTWRHVSLSHVGLV